MTLTYEAIVFNCRCINDRESLLLTRSFLDELKPAALNETEVEETLKQEFVAQQLLQLARILDLSDEVGRSVAELSSRKWSENVQMMDSENPSTVSATVLR